MFIASSAIGVDASFFLSNLLRLRIQYIIRGLGMPSSLSIDMIPTSSKYIFITFIFFSRLYFTLSFSM